ncbi:MAG: threonyl-tRNA synthetase editing domain-containing protein [Candidatus Helarchaeota archaeon]
MRFLSFHVDYFRHKVTKRGRSKLFEDISEDAKENRVEDALIFFISMEKQDEKNSEIINKSVSEIKKIADQLKVTNIVLIPFAHLFGKLSSPEFALKSLKEIYSQLKSKNFNVLRLPFGWFNELEMKAKGHPLSRISRIIE